MTGKVDHVGQSAAQEAMRLQQLNSDLLNESIQETNIFKENQSVWQSSPQNNPALMTGRS